MRANPTRKRTLRDDSGTSLTEFAIVAPLFVLLLYWSQFFTDVSIVKLKVEEAARYATWEMTAQRPPTEIQQEIVDRFADLASPLQRQRPAGVRAFQSVQVTSVVTPNETALLTGGVHVTGALNLGLPPGLQRLVDTAVRSFMNFLNNLINTTVQWAIRRFELNQNGEVSSRVTMTVNNTLFPGGSLLGIFFDSGRPPTITMTARSPSMLVDTWKAWPGYYGPPGFTDRSTDVYTTYRNGGGAGTVEKIVAARMKKMAFFGIDENLFGRIISLFARITLIPMDPRNKGTWSDKGSGSKPGGPIAMWPVEQPRHPWVPGYGLPVQRIGEKTTTSATARVTVDSPDPGVDRARLTGPHRFSTELWNDRGGYSRTPITVPNNVPQAEYAKAIRCRDAFYMGSTRAQNSSWTSGWIGRAFPSCQN